jgi:hypothetical protein
LNANASVRSHGAHLHTSESRSSGVCRSAPPGAVAPPGLPVICAAAAAAAAVAAAAAARIRVTSAAYAGRPGCQCAAVVPAGPLGRAAHARSAQPERDRQHRRLLASSSCQ